MIIGGRSYPMRNLLTEWRRDLAFTLKAKEADREYRELQRKNTPADRFEFARRIFGISQIEEEINALIEFVSPIKPTSILEIGVESGGNLFLLGESFPTVRKRIAIDLAFRNSAALRRFSRRELETHFLRAQSAAPSTFERVRRILGGDKIDFLFIDGDHTYEGVRGDFVAYRNLVRPGGIIAFHDVVADHSTKFGIKTEGNTGGVPILWADLASRFPSRTFIQDPAQDGRGIGALVNSEDVCAATLP